MTNFTIAIPTYNGAERLPLVLDKLLAQIGVEGLSWEIIVVDNNSTDNTKKIISRYQENWSDKIPLKYCYEAQQGAGFARKKAVEIASSPLIGFLDDDNIPAENWVAAAYEFAQKYPKAGAYASQIHGDFSGELPPDFDRIKSFFAITERGEQPLLYQPAIKVIPPSAGLVVRREAWLESVPEQCILGGRVPGSMLTGEDTETISYIQKAGWEIWYNPAMEVIHKIPQHRTQKDYLIKFFRGIGLSRYVTRMLGVKPWLKPLAFFAYTANDSRKIIRHLLKYGLKLRTDVVAACEFELYINSLKSPFYLWKNGYLNTVEPNYTSVVKSQAGLSGIDCREF
ncbi:MAG: glycosyltransferase [Okeania sp. SIO2G4]|uniref:hormogonium polysaccharide biosynthesis glycosyltransferase HpsE n=1 Tax=unclassified Okeania TaxID=2634635 RepID=UPI0013BCF4D9|nr:MULTISPECIES: hormogonium polysaccharide biosynthesis glycosyltransferase HpsE [unclassified Okeania]NEP06401.1 glycosyltransferase [Okeania sp. SIO4D6]NEP38948.1 glycosyltransferase [Okeania sp. SIO2H7]NEP73854.1 glycosyltransferase [Okeania sp. SIO2G5]NEP94553.1 glycosyltransferase [Okeania sp. SIO2F5]NEQ92380.1 glycosyltransferase [Okeania sp. SIO2G4]